MSSHDRFGYEWDIYSAMSPRYEEQFKNWTYPLTEVDWRGKRFLDAGCGMGRNSYWPLRYGATGSVSFDLDPRSVNHAKQTLKEFQNAEVVLRSIYDINWKNEFDVAFSIGVIHHLKDPKRALRNMIDALKSGGTLLVWVYSFEGNEWITRFVDPIRIHVTSKLPLPLVHALSYLCSVPLFVFVKIFKGPSLYLKQLSTFNFWHLHSIVFDQLIPDIAHYWKQGEVSALLDGLPLQNISIEKTPEGTGWILVAQKI